MSKDNLKLWKSVEKTDPKHTKEVKFGRKFTAIDPQYQIMNATEQFGPMGYGWGPQNEDYRIELIGEDYFLFYTAILTFLYNNETGQLPISASLIINPNTKSGRKPDEDCYKKVQTDAITKGLSRLGFNSDVFMGKFDDNKYVQSLKNELRDKDKAESATSVETPSTIDKSKKYEELKKACMSKGLSQTNLNKEVVKKFKKSEYTMCSLDELDKLIEMVKKMKEVKNG